MPASIQHLHCIKGSSLCKKRQEKEVKSIHIGKEMEFADNNLFSINNLMESIKRIPETICEFYSLHDAHIKARCVLYTSNEHPGIEITKQYHLQKH